jgi:hypothetical protein
LFSNEQITPADAVLAKENANEARFVSLFWASYPKLTSCYSSCKYWIRSSCRWGSSLSRTFLKGMYTKNLVSRRVLTLIDGAHRGGDIRRIRTAPSRSPTQFILPDLNAGAQVTSVSGANNPDRDHLDTLPPHCWLRRSFHRRI